MGFSFLLAAVKGLKKKKKVRSKADEFEGARRRRRVMVKPDSKSSGFDKIPEELLMMILVRLPAKHVIKCMCVSQLWYSLIASRYFTKLFFEFPSSAKPPRLLAYLVDNGDQREYKFLSSSSTQDDTSVSVPIDQVLNIPGLGGCFVNALRGLICVRLGRNMRICNLTTRQHVTLPIIKSGLLAESYDNLWNTFAYDPVHDEYKVLSTVWEVSTEEERVVRSEHQVLVLGPGASWRNTQSHIYPHRPYSQGPAINGVLYYGAWIDRNTCVVMSFDLASEDFNLIELPIEAGIIWHVRSANLINYRGKLAVFEYSQLASDASVYLWVMEDAGKRKWSNKTLVLPLSHMKFVHGDELAILGTGRRGEVMLAKMNNISNEQKRVVIYDLENNKITRSLEIYPPLWLFAVKGYGMAIWEDDSESIMYLET